MLTKELLEFCGFHLIEKRKMGFSVCKNSEFYRDSVYNESKVVSIYVITYLFPFDVDTND